MRFDFNSWFARTQLTESKRLKLFRKIAVMLRNGTRLEDVLSNLQMRATKNGKKPNEAMGVVLEHWLRGIRNGGKFSEAVDGWIPIPEQMLIMAGEEAGKLPEQLERLIEVVTASKAIKRAVVGGVFYPTVLLTVTFAYLMLFGVKVIPEFAKVVDPSKWGGMARSLYLMSNFVTAWGVTFALGVVAMIAGLILSLPVLTGRIRIVLDHVPPWSIYRLVVGSGFMLSLSALLMGGGRVQDALITLSKTSNRYLRERMEGFLLGVNSGLNPGEAMNASGYHFPSQEIVDDLAVYAEHTGSFSESLAIIAEEWLEDGVNQVATQMGLFKGMAIAVMTIVLMWITAGFFGIQQEITAVSRGMMR